MFNACSAGALAKLSRVFCALKIENSCHFLLCLFCGSWPGRKSRGVCFKVYIAGLHPENSCDFVVLLSLFCGSPPRQNSRDVFKGFFVGLRPDRTLVVFCLSLFCVSALRKLWRCVCVIFFVGLRPDKTSLNYLFCGATLLSCEQITLAVCFSHPCHHPPFIFDPLPSPLPSFPPPPPPPPRTLHCARTMGP